MSEDFKMEFGDVMYSLLSLACEANIDAEECLDKVIKKYPYFVTYFFLSFCQ